jgi:hypothetical protein
MRVALVCALALCVATTVDLRVAFAGVGCTTAAECDDANPCTLDGCPVPGGECVHDLTGWTVGTLTSARLTRTAAVGQERLGVSVALDGDLAVSGALASPAAAAGGGAAVIFRRAGATWAQEALLTGSNTAAGDAFGTSVAASAGVVAVGAPLASPVASQSGAVYLFRKLGGVWTETQRLSPPDAAALDWFGQAVAISGDTLVVGAPRDDDKGASSGAAYVYRWDGVEWTLRQKLVPQDGAKGDEFGTAVAIDGAALVVGARFDDDPTAGPDAGSAYVFRRGTAAFTQEAKLVASGAAQFDLFGSAVAISGDRVVGGAPQADVGGVADIGAAWVFARSGGAWAVEGKLTSAGGGPLDKLGSAVAISGRTALVGAPLFGAQGASYGRAWFYELADAGDWRRVREFSVAGGTVNDELGVAVALEGTYAMVGADRDPAKAQNAGAVHAIAVAPPVVCDDGNPCTVDSCLPASGNCVHAPRSGECSDGDPCTLNTVCEASACVAAGGAGACEDDNACTEDTCAGEAGCQRTPVTADCDDQDACTSGDACQDGVCAGAATVACDDADPCTADSCDPVAGCVTAPLGGASCDDGDPCTVTDVCKASGDCGGAVKSCTTPPAPVCADADTRRTFAPVGACDAASGECEYAPTDTACPFGCSNGACADSTCQVAPAGTACDDKDPCTEGDACDGAGGCAGATKDCSSLDAGCVVGVCTAATGKCVAATKANGTPCDDGTLCTMGERCQGGLCGGGTTVKCTDSDVCTADSCDSKKGCINFPIEGCCTATRPCEDNQACVGQTCRDRFCAPCTDDGECGQNGVCAQGTLGGFCTRTCDAGCGHDSSCFTEITVGDGAPVCGPDAGLPTATARCDGDDLVPQVGCGEDGTGVTTCETGCVSGACCPEGQHREGAECVADAVEPVEVVPDAAPDEAPDAAGDSDAAPDSEPDAAADAAGPDTGGRLQGSGCSGSQAPSALLWLGLALLAWTHQRRRRTL